MIRYGLGVLVAFGVLVGGSFVEAQETAARLDPRPNVLFIAIDDLNDWTGFLGGHPDAKTPHLDRLAARSLVFERAYCAAPACNPSRAALLTGMAPHTTGVYLNGQPYEAPTASYEKLPEAFMRGGYDVSGCGKIFHGGTGDAAWYHRVAPKTRVPKAEPLTHSPARQAHFDWGPLAESEEAMVDHGVVTWAIDEMGRSRDKPFFVACGITKPHLPWYVPQKYFDRFPESSVTLPAVTDNDLADVPPAGRKMANPGGDHARVVRHDQWQAGVQGYLAAIAYCDYEVGRLLDGLAASGHDDDTIVVLWGDHGWHLGEKQHWRKFTLWEVSCRVPLTIRLPGSASVGQRTDAVVSLLDLYPTLTELCGIEPPETLEGRSLAKLLKAPETPWPHHVLTTHGRLNHTIRTERYRYLRYQNGDEELYDHTSDPHEWRNLASDSSLAEVKRELAAKLPSANAKDAPRGATPDD